MRTHRKTLPNTLAAAENPAEGEAARNARLEAKALDMLARMGEIGMRFIERLDKRASGEMDEAELEAFSRVGDDCNAFVKMSRSVRHIIVLEQEIAGLRAAPIPRAANGNAAAGPPKQGGAREASNDRHDRPDYEGYDTYQAYFDGPVTQRIIRVSEAVQRDLAGTDMEEEARRATHTARLQIYSAITPHPALDACLAEMTARQRGELYSFGLGQGPLPERSSDRQRKINTS